MTNLLESVLFVAAICSLVYIVTFIIDKLDRIQSLVEMYGENACKHFREEEQRRYFEEREGDKNGGLQ